MDCKDYLYNKQHIQNNDGFKPLFIPDYLYDFQSFLTKWSIEKGRSAIFADCGLGKTIMEMVWAQNVVQHTNKSVLLITPLAVSIQMIKEAEKFGIDVVRSKDGITDNKKRIVITNYENLHKFDSNNFAGVVADESSILKNFDGKTKQLVTIFMRKIKYRLLATATAAPNDYIELGTSSEALGYLGYMDMLGKFFKNEQNNCATNRRGRFTEATKWRLKGHAHKAFWRWVTSWSRAIRKPSDIGYSDKDFILNPLHIHNHMLKVDGFTPEGIFPQLNVIAVGLKEIRDEVRKTIDKRCQTAANMVKDIDDYSVVWCNLNDEGDLLEKLIPDSVQVKGSDKDDAKEEKLLAFSNGDVKRMIIKPKIGGFGLNWQHCNRMVFFPTYSYEQFYQAVRRCYRFGQKRDVYVDVVYSEGLENVVYNLERKRKQADDMFKQLIEHMNNSLYIKRGTDYITKQEIPTWL